MNHFTEEKIALQTRYIYITFMQYLSKSPFPIGILLLILEKFVANPGGCTDYGRIDIRI